MAWHRTRRYGGRIADLAVSEAPANPPPSTSPPPRRRLQDDNAGVPSRPFSIAPAHDVHRRRRVAPSDLSVVWVGTGEPTIAELLLGRWIYQVGQRRSPAQDGLDETRTSQDPHRSLQPEYRLDCRRGHLWGSNAERGVFKTTDAALHGRSSL